MTFHLSFFLSKGDAGFPIMRDNALPKLNTAIFIALSIKVKILNVLKRGRFSVDALVKEDKNQIASRVNKLPLGVVTLVSC